MTITYTTGTKEPIHPDMAVAARFREVALSDCQFGCKVYADPRSAVRVVAHNSAYGCKE